MEYLFTLKDENIFLEPEFPTPNTFEKRKTVKAIVLNEEGKYGFVTNSVHGFVLLAGGGADSDDLQQEIIRECTEELGCEVEVIREIGVAHEFRNRNAKEYETVCFVARATNQISEDLRTEDEKQNNIQVVWLTEDEVIKILTEQEEQVKSGEVEFYNTAFNIIRDKRFFLEHLHSK